MRVFNFEMRHGNVNGGICYLVLPANFLKATEGKIGANFSALRMNAVHAILLRNRLIGLVF